MEREYDRATRLNNVTRSSIALLTVSTIFVCAASTAQQPSSKPASPRPVRADDPQKTRDLRDRMRVLRRKLDDLDSKLTKMEVGKEDGARDKRQGDPQADRNSPSLEDEARALLEWAAAFELYSFLERRLSNLGKLDRLQSEVSELVARRSRVVEQDRRLGTIWDSKRSELINAEVVLMLARTRLRRTIDPSEGLVESVRAQLRREGIDPEKPPPPPPARLRREGIDPKGIAPRNRKAAVARASKVVERCEDRAKALRRELKDLWNKKSTIQDELIEIDITLSFDRSQISPLIDTRAEWDRDFPPN